MSVNVNRGLTDQFYRYKMPKILAKVEGKGNGIKTVVVNMVEVAKALNRPPMYPTKYFGCILGAQVNYDNKNDRYIVNGSHEASRLQDLLDGFIQKYVLCANCSNPETVLTVLPKKNIITTSCKACGHAGTISGNDKLATFILKNPPNKPATTDTGPPKAEKKKDKKKKKDEKNGDANGSDENDEKEKDEGQEDGEDEDWCEDTDENAVARRMEELSVGAKGLMHTDDLDKNSSERLDIFLEFVNKKKKTGDAFDVATQKEIVAEAERLEVKEKAAMALCHILFDQNILTQLKTHRVLLMRLLNEDTKAQKYFLRGIEMTIKDFEKELLPKVPHILKELFDLDLVDENVFYDWHAKGNKKFVGKELTENIRNRAAAFIKWLREAEEEESSEESDDEDDEEAQVVDFNERAQSSHIQVVQEPTPKKIVAVDDIDIDAI